MGLYEEQFSEQHDFPRVEAPSKTLIIASTPRCGSHMLGHALYETGQFGFPLEYVQPKNLKAWKTKFNQTSIPAVLQEIQSRRTSPNGVFGIKIHYAHIKKLGGFEHLLSYFPNACFVLLNRKDYLKQAVSLAIARQTGIWIEGQESDDITPQYNYEQIDSCLREVIQQNASWKYLLAASGVPFLELDFEHVKEHLSESIQTIASFMELDFDLTKIQVQTTTQPQSSSLNEEWINMFNAENNTPKPLHKQKSSNPLKRLFQ